MAMVTKGEIRAALKAHHEAINAMKQGLRENNGDKISTFLEAANCAWDLVEKLLAKKYPDFIELGSDEEEEVAIDEEEEEEDFDADEDEEEGEEEDEDEG